VPVSRVHDDAHWSSDAFLGWAVGVGIAELVDRWRSGDQRGDGSLRLTPVALGDGAGIQIEWKF
jgi:membrane-associated phospholipid phosphatase